jgi:hypothetical protein
MKPGRTKTILFVGAAHAGASSVLDALRAGGSDPIIAGDVYLALARWGKGAVDLAAVIVCVDLLQPSEFEFFKLAARDHGRIPVYVCARPEASAKLDRAVAGGGRGRIAAGDVAELRCELAGACEDDRFPASPAIAAPLESLSIPEPNEARSPALTELTRLNLADEAGGPNGDDESDSGELTDEPARVPWKTYANRPVRKPPVRAGAVPPSPQPAADPFDGPLLSPEELEALMREDFRTLPTEGPGRREGVE